MATYRTISPLIALLIIVPIVSADRASLEPATSPTFDATNVPTRYVSSLPGITSVGSYTLRVTLVLAALAVSAAAVRWIATNRHKSARFAQRELRVLEHLRLTPKVSVHLVQLGDRRVLIGSSDACVAYLTDAESPATDPQLREAVTEFAREAHSVAA